MLQNKVKLIFCGNISIRQFLQPSHVKNERAHHNAYKKINMNKRNPQEFSTIALHNVHKRNQSFEYLHLHYHHKLEIWNAPKSASTRYSTLLGQRDTATPQAWTTLAVIEASQSIRQYSQMWNVILWWQTRRMYSLHLCRILIFCTLSFFCGWVCRHSAQISWMSTGI